MRTILLISLTLLLFCPAQAEPDADVKNPKTYEATGLSFSYPGNWKVTEDEVEDGVRTIFIESEGDALFSIQVYAVDVAPTDIRSYSTEFSKSAAESLGDDLTMSRSEFSDVKSVVSGKPNVGIREFFVITYQGFEIPHQREHYEMRRSQEVVLLMNQVATEDLKAASPGFELLQRSFQWK